MANVIKLRKGLDINLKGKAAETYATVKEPGFYALVPDDFPGVTPKVVVKEQEYVMAGGPLFIDKYHPEVKFVSPVSGVVTSVERGARRKVLNIVVEAAAEQDYEDFGKKNVASMDAEAVKSALLEAGLFAFIKQRPYDIIADPTVTPKGIFISAFDTNPLAPDFEFALKGEEANFQTGLDALAKLAKTYLNISVKQNAAALTQAKNVTITAFDGPNPAGNVGVQINHLDPVSKGETVWTIDPQAVIFIGRLFNTGHVDFTRTVAVTGSEVLKPAYCKLQVGALLTNVFAAVIPFYTMSVYDRVVPNNALDSLWVLTGAVVVVALFDLVVKMLRSYLLEAAARKADVAMSSHVFAQALRLRAASRPASGGVLANIVRDFESVREFVTSSTLTVLGDVPFMLFFLVLIAIIGHWLVLVPLALIPLTVAASMLIRRPLTRLLGANMQESAQRTAHLFETMNGVDTLKCLGAEAWARRQWEMLTVKISENSVQMREWTSLGTYLSLLATSLSAILIVMFGALMIGAGDLTMGQLIAVSMLAARAITPATQIAALIVRYEQTRQALEALDKIMESPTDEGADSLHLPRMSGRIDFRDTHFAYPDSAPVLKGLNLSIRPGERVGFIGRIGSGKSTLFKLLLNLYSPDQGAVMVDGMAVSQLEPQSLRRQVGYVPQDVVLFHGDIRENILLGSSHVSDTQLIEALRLSCLDETLSQMPNGLGTQVGERGDRLSGGQRQAVSIARALVRQPRMLLLDEPSSMMDPATEARLIDNLRSIKGVTMLLVTHRMAMLPLVDRLVVLDQGRVVMDGPRNEVLRKLQGPPGPSGVSAAPREAAA